MREVVVGLHARRPSMPVFGAGAATTWASSGTAPGRTGRRRRPSRSETGQEEEEEEQTAKPERRREAEAPMACWFVFGPFKSFCGAMCTDDSQCGAYGPRVLQVAWAASDHAVCLPIDAGICDVDAG